jgi:hypothetical protein
VSPGGTRITVVEPALVESGEGVASYVVRGFFGESAAGRWTVLCSQAGAGPAMTLTNISMTFFGMRSNISLPAFPRKTGADPWMPLPNAVAISAPASVQCNKDFEVQISPARNTSLELYLRDGQHRGLHLTSVPAGPSTTVNIPCVVGASGYFLYAEDRFANISGHFPIHIDNFSADMYIVEPTPYESLVIDGLAVSFRLQISMAWNHLLGDSRAQSAIVGLYDYAQGKVLYRDTILYSDFELVTFPIHERVEKGVLFVIPAYPATADGCSTLIQPIFVIEHGTEEPLEWDLPLPPGCPTPLGINADVYQDPDPTMRIVLSIVMIALGVINMVVVTIYHLKCRKPFAGVQEEHLLESGMNVE